MDALNTGIAWTPRARVLASTTGMDLLLASVAGFMVLSVARTHLLIPQVGAIRPILILAVLSIALFLLDRHPERDLHRIPRTAFLLLLALFAWMAVGVPFALRQGATFHWLTEDFGKTVILFALVAASVRHFRDLERLAWLYFAGAAIYATVVVVRYQVSGESWRLANLITYDANDAALLFVTAVPLGVYFLLRSHRPRILRLLEGVAMVALMVAFVRTGSRGGFLAMAGIGFLLLLRYRAIPTWLKFAGTATIALVLWIGAGSRYLSEMGTIANPAEDYNLTSPTGRLQVWQRGMGYMFDNPIVGVGAANFQAAEGLISARAKLQELGIGIKWSAPHNSFIQVGAETGIPGLVLFLAFLLSIATALRRVARTRSGSGGAADAPAEMAEVLLISLAGFMIGAFFLSLAYSAMLYVLAALAVALMKVESTARATGELTSTRSVRGPGSMRAGAFR